MSRGIVVFDQFAVGEYGKQQGWSVPKGSFTANNMLVYQTGEIGVRTGVRERTPSGVPTGIVVGYGNTPVPTKDAWFAVGNTVYTFDILAGNNLLTATGSMAGTATSVLSVAKVNTDLYITAKGKTNSYKVQINTGTGVPAALTTLTGSPSGRAITSYGDRLVIGDITGSLENRIRFSDALDYNSWPSANFIDIGDGWFINGLLPQRQHLVITKQNGFYILTGVPGVNPVLRKVSNDFGPLTWPESALGRDDIIYTWPIFGTQPGYFDGAKQTRLFRLANHISTSGTGDAFPPENGVSVLSDTSFGAAYLAKTGSKAILLNNGVFSYHTFGVSMSGYTDPTGGSGRLVPWTDGGGAASSAKFYVWDTGQDRPGLETGTHDRAGDASDSPIVGTLTLPEQWAGDGDEFYVRGVAVDFRKWDTGGSANNHFDLTVDALRTYQGGTVSSNTVSFDEAPGSSSTSGTLARKIFGFGEQPRGNGFQLRFENIKGVAFQRIEVFIDRDSVRL